MEAIRQEGWGGCFAICPSQRCVIIKRNARVLMSRFPSVFTTIRSEAQKVKGHKRSEAAELANNFLAYI